MPNKTSVKRKIIKVFYDAAPNTLVKEHLYNHLSDIPQAVIDDALEELKGERIITTNPSASNMKSVFPNLKRDHHYLVEYPKNYPYKDIIRIGDVNLPRLLDTDSARAEDVNQLSLVVKNYSDNIKEQV